MDSGGLPQVRGLTDSLAPAALGLGDPNARRSPPSEERVAQLMQAAEKGNPTAKYEVGLYFMKEDITKAVEYFKQAALQGHVESITQLGVLCSLASPEMDCSYELYRIASQKNYDRAQYLVGWCLFSGNGVCRNLGQAKRELEKISDRNMDAQILLSLIALTEKPGAPDRKIAAHHLGNAMRAGNPVATSLYLLLPTMDSVEKTEKLFFLAVSAHVEQSCEKTFEIALHLISMNDPNTHPWAIQCLELASIAKPQAFAFLAGLSYCSSGNEQIVAAYLDKAQSTSLAEGIQRVLSQASRKVHQEYDLVSKYDNQDPSDTVLGKRRSPEKQTTIGQLMELMQKEALSLLGVAEDVEDMSGAAALESLKSLHSN